MQGKNSKAPRVAIISDLHFGVHGDSEKWHKTMLDYSVWLSNTLKEMGIGDLFILGDVFDNRKAVGVETMQMANDFFRNLLGVDGRFIRIIAGNHDCFYEDNANTSSVSMFSGWHGVELVYEEPCEIVWGPSCRALLCPWGTDMRALAETGKTADVVFGHFAVSSFADVPGHLYTGGYTPEEITKCAPLVFSGHFHLRDEKKFRFDGVEKKIIMVGSPYQLNWADAGSTKGVYIFHPITKDIEFVENTVSPRHVQIGVGDEIPDCAIRNNIVRVVATTVEEAKQVESLVAFLSEKGAADVGARISVADTSMPEDFKTEDSGGAFDQHQMLVDYVNACDFGDKKAKVLEVLDRIYGVAVAGRKESV